MVDSLSIEDLAVKIESINSKEDLRDILKDLCLLSSNEKSNEKIVNLLDKAIEKSKLLNDEESFVDLIGYKIPLLYSYRKNIVKVRELISQMKNISEKNCYTDRLAWAYSYIWYVEKFEGNKERSTEAMEQAIELLNKFSYENEYIYYFIRYSYAFELWIENHDVNSIEIFEECADYFLSNHLYRSLSQTLGILSIIYMRTHETKKSLGIIKRILSPKSLFEELPLDIQAISYYCAGLAHMLNMNLEYSEIYFNKSYTILKPIYKKSIYLNNFITLHSHLASIRALKGNLEEAYEMVKDANQLLEDEFVKKNLDKQTKIQIIHTHNLTKYYVISRLKSFNSDDYEDLINTIYNNSKNHYSNFIMFSEYILSSKLDSEKLEALLQINNFSISTVKHIIKYMLEKKKSNKLSNEQKRLNCIEVLNGHLKTEKTTFIEYAYTDLLLAQELYKLKRFNEISPLLRKYKNQINRVEVLEMKIFMEAFIQVGAFNDGDPLGPALQYMAIKRCRQYNFSSLESILLNYINSQRINILNVILK